MTGCSAPSVTCRFPMSVLRSLGGETNGVMSHHTLKNFYLSRDTAALARGAAPPPPTHPLRCRATARPRRPPARPGSPRDAPRVPPRASSSSPSRTPRRRRRRLWGTWRRTCTARTTASCSCTSSPRRASAATTEAARRCGAAPRAREARPPRPDPTRTPRRPPPTRREPLGPHEGAEQLERFFLAVVKIFFVSFSTYV